MSDRDFALWDGLWAGVQRRRQRADVRRKLIAAGYDHCLDPNDPENGPIDMTGIALTPDRVSCPSPTLARICRQLGHCAKSCFPSGGCND